MANERAPSLPRPDESLDQRGPGDGELENLQQYADEIGIEYGSILKYRQVAKSWLIENRVSNTCWKVHQMLATHPELIKQGMTVTLAHAALGQKNVGRTGPQADTKASAGAPVLTFPLSGV